MPHIHGHSTIGRANPQLNQLKGKSKPKKRIRNRKRNVMIHLSAKTKQNQTKEKKIAFLFTPLTSCLDDHLYITAKKRRYSHNYGMQVE
jgi:hypothetical protein